MTGVQQDPRKRLATAWLGGCSGCHMSLLDLDERLIPLAAAARVVFTPIADLKDVPDDIDVALVEGAVANADHLRLARELRDRAKILVSFGDCAVTGNVTSLRNALAVDDLLDRVYHEGPGASPLQDTSPGAVLPALLSTVVPLHAVVAVDAFIPGCPPDPERIWNALRRFVFDEYVATTAAERTFG